MVALLLVFAALVIDDPPPARPVSASDRAAYQSARAAAGHDADRHVRLALWCEAHGLDRERAQELASAVAAEPAHAAARGLLGLVEHRDHWRKPEEIVGDLRADPDSRALLTAYHERRDQAADSAAGHWSLASWCEQVGLSAQATAHFTAVTRLDPTCAEAWEHLGYENHGGRWLTPEQLAGEAAEARAQDQANRGWRPRLIAWKKALRDKARQSEAVRELGQVRDPRAVPSIVQVFGQPGGSSVDQLWAVYLLGRIDAPAAAHALAVLAASTPSDRVRSIAADTLAGLDARVFVGLLINRLRDPIRATARFPNGPDAPGVLQLEDSRLRLERVYNTPRSRRLDQRRFGDSPIIGSPALQLSPRPRWGLVPTTAGPPTPAAVSPGQRKFEAVRARIEEDAQPIQQRNAQTALGNARLLQVLRRVTGVDLGPDRDRWTAWWNDQLGYGSRRYEDEPPPKPVVVQNVAVANPPPPPVFLVYTPFQSCFSAGTFVWTDAGLRAIEDLRIGDQVLRQDTSTGALSFGPVVAIHHNPPAPVLRITIGGETISATAIHRFWGAGQGWVMARNLKPGDLLRTLGGTAAVEGVDRARALPVYNLDVAGTQTFFVGKRGALVHDNTLIVPVSRPFDALPDIAALAR